MKPTPVVVTRFPTDWWAVVLEGIASAAVGAAVAALVAVYVVKMQRKNDRAIALELTARDAAKRLGSAAFVSAKAMTELLGVYTEAAMSRRELIVMDWHASVSEDYPDIWNYVEESKVLAHSAALSEHERLVSEDLSTLFVDADAYRAGLPSPGPYELLKAREAVHRQAVLASALAVSTVLDAFRRFGPDWREQAPRA